MSSIIALRSTEKAYSEQAKNTYIFNVPPSATKQAIASAVATTFEVTVTDVRTLVRKGKPTRYSRGRRAYPGVTNRQDKKIAYVTLKDGDAIKTADDESTETQSAADEKTKETVATDEKKSRKAKKSSDEQEGAES